MSAFTLIEGCEDAEKGATVYRLGSTDYGLAHEDTEDTGEKHISVTLKSDGGYPSFTVPVSKLKEIL